MDVSSRFSVLHWLSCICMLVCCSMASGNVVLIGHNVTISFDSIEANFAPAVRGSGECGVLYQAEPLDACSSLTNRVDHLFNVSSPYVLIVRGACSFEDKVRRAQKSGFKAAIVFDNEVDVPLVAMAGNSDGIKIHAVFISKESGDMLKTYIDNTDVELWIVPSFENSAWSIMAISFTSLLAMSAVLATCFFVRRHRIRRDHPRASRVPEFHGMSSRLVKAMPSLIFTSVLEDNCTSRTCAICLEDYNVGEKLRVLPCCHKFHALCVDLWLTSWRTFCPVCKRDARTSTGEPPASESTPLLSSAPVPATSSASALSYFGSSISSSSAMSASQTPSISNSYLQNSLMSYQQSPTMHVSRSTSDLRNTSSSRSHLVSPHSLGYPYPSSSPFNSQYMSPYMPSPSNASVSYMGSSRHHRHQPLHYSGSAASFSPMASTLSLPEC